MKKKEKSPLALSNDGGKTEVDVTTTEYLD